MYIYNYVYYSMNKSIYTTVFIAFVRLKVKKIAKPNVKIIV